MRHLCDIKKNQIRSFSGIWLLKMGPYNWQKGRHLQVQLEVQISKVKLSGD